MKMKLRFRNGLRLTAAAASMLALAACGGADGGTASTPIPAPTPSPSPTPSPTPTPTPSPSPTPQLPASSFQTQEYNRSTGPSFHGAISAWQLGATGKGVAIGIVDSGIDPSNPEFSGRISSASADVAGTRGLSPEDDHGTMVAIVAAGARNGAGVMGIAYDATLIGMRADAPGSCAGSDGCRFGDSAIAAGIDGAVNGGAKVVNLSLGGSAAGSQTRAAVGRAAAAGVVVIVAAGNDADAATPSSDPNNPNPFATSLRAAGNGNVIIAGSVNSSGVLSAFSNRAGGESSWYLNALGENICCEYANGVIKVTTTNGQQFQTVYSGTSFSAPQIAGAAALLRQAFPNLTANQVVNLLLSTARDAGASGTDGTYGRGILDIKNAFSPQGQTTLAGTNTTVPIMGNSMVTSAPMGDALAQAQLKAIVLDSYSRAYAINLAANGRAASQTLKLTNALSSPSHLVETGTDRLALAFSVRRGFGNYANSSSDPLRLSLRDSDTARVLAARIVAQLHPATKLGFAFAQGSGGLVAQLRGQDRPAFMIASEPSDDLGFDERDQTAIAIRQELGRWGLTFSFDKSRLANAHARGFDLSGQRAGQDSSRRYGLAVDRRFGSFESSIALSWVNERQAILGARLQQGLGGAGAQSLFVDASLAWRPSSSWRVGAAWRRGHTEARTGGLVSQGSTLISNAWAVDATRYGIFAADDSLSFRLSQPLRISSGGLNLTLPTAYSYETLAATNEVSRLSLTPRGREMAAELGWRGHLAQGWGKGALFYRRNPGNVANSPDDKGVAFAWSVHF